MDSQTIKFSLQSIEIPAINVYVHTISILLVIFLIKLIFGRQISNVVREIKYKTIDFFNKKSYPDWIAKCRERKYWPQKQDVKTLDLKGRLIKSISFVIQPVENPDYWRAGIVLGNEKLKANEIVDVRNGITIHTGSDYGKEDNILPVWKYYENFNASNPDTSSVNSEQNEAIKFSVSINEKNFMQVKVQDEVVFAQRVDPSYRRRVNITAWCDSKPNCKIKFKDIKYSLWS